MSTPAAPPPAEDSILGRYYAVPLMTRAVCTLSIFFWLVGALLFPFLPMMMMICPGAILELQIWRWFTAPFASQGMINVIIGIFVFGQISISFEREMGTIGMGFLFFLFNVLANVLFTVVSIFLAPVFPMARLLSIANCASGLWLSFMSFLVVRSERSLQPTQSFCGVINIPTKLYPWFLVGLFGLLGAPILDNVCGIAVGYLFFYGYLTRLVPSEAWFQRCEASPRIAFAASAPGFITWTGALFNAAAAAPPPAAPSQSGNIMSGGVIRRGNAAPAAAAAAGGGGGGGFAAFQGSGQTLGGPPAASSWAGFFSSPSAAPSAPSAPAASAAGGHRLGQAPATLRTPDSGLRGTYAVLPTQDEDDRAAARNASPPRAAPPTAPQAAPAATPPQEVDADAVAQLCSMGFPPARAQEALQRSGGDLAAAVTHLTSS